MPSPILFNPIVPGTDIQQISLVKLPHNSEGEWTAAMTVAALPATFGGDGVSTGVVVGDYDPHQGIFLASNDVNALNSNQDDGHISLSPAGHHALVQRPDGTYLASRTSLDLPFGAPVKVNGFSGLADPRASLGPVGGLMKVFYTDGTSILMESIDLSDALVVGPPVVVSNSLQPGAKPLQPFPAVGADGDIEGLFFAEEVVAKTGPGTGDADPVWAGDLDAATPPVMVVQRPDYQCCGAVGGGFMHFSHQILSPGNHLMHLEVAWLLGDVEAPGGSADIRAAAVSQGNPLTTLLFASADIAPKASIAGINGALGLDVASFEFILPFPHAGLDGIGDVSFPIPATPSLSGLKMALQGLVTDVTAGKFTLTNTSWLAIQ